MYAISTRSTHNTYKKSLSSSVGIDKKTGCSCQLFADRISRHVFRKEEKEDGMDKEKPIPLFLV